VSAIEPLGVELVVPVGSEATPLAQRQLRLRVAAPGGDQPTLRLRGLARDHVDDPVDGIDAPERATGPGDDLDAVDVLEQQVLLMLLSSSKLRSVSRLAMTWAWAIDPADHTAMAIAPCRNAASRKAIHVPLRLRRDMAVSLQGVNTGIPRRCRTLVESSRTRACKN